MTTRNSVLLIVKQNQGIEYNSLLNKIASEYGSINSARAALSRALKDLNALGLVTRKENRLFVTDKGTAKINSDLKNKLLLRLNQLINAKNGHLQIDSIIQQLHTLIERSKMDSDLLKAAKGSTNFYISDLVRIREELEKHTQHLNYLCKIFSEQINSIKELNFFDSKEFKWNQQLIKLILNIAQNSETEDFFVECVNQDFLKQVKEELNAKSQGKNLFLQRNDLKKFLNMVEKFSSTKPNKVNIFLPAVQVKIDLPRLFFVGPFKKIQQLTKDLH